jgi:hypothetical protein
MPTVVVHLMGEDPFVAEIEELPLPTDQTLTVVNLRRRDNKPVHYIGDATISVIFPWHRINFVEVLQDESAESDVDLFFRT